MGQTTCTARFSPGAMQTEGLTIAHGTGRITGVIGAGAREGSPARLTTDLTVEEVDAVLLEGLFLERPGGCRTDERAGEYDGALHHGAAFGDARNKRRDRLRRERRHPGQGRPRLETAGGPAHYGILRLRFPDLKDSGLSFKTLEGQVSITDGVFRVAPFRLSERAYVLERVVPPSTTQRTWLRAVARSRCWKG